MRILVLIYYCRKWHVSYFTFNGLVNNPNFVRFHSKETSRECHFFTPHPKDQKQYDVFCVQVQWSTVRYLAIVDSHSPAFGKYGGIACFKRELARLGNFNMREVNDAIRQLDGLNPPKKPVRLNYFTSLSRVLGDYYQGKNTAEFLRILSKSAKSGYINDVAKFILVVTQRDEWFELLPLIYAWTPPDSNRLRLALTSTLQSYLNFVPEDLGKASVWWWPEWKKAFNIGDLPDLSSPMIQTD